jgi:DNA (cytosine-5)-methyltransferase 1
VPIPVIDLFAGPGGLNEGFSNVTRTGESSTFKTIASFEMDKFACETLTLRGAYRHAIQAKISLEPYYAYLRNESDLDSLKNADGFADAFAHAEHEVHQIELGANTRSLSDRIIEGALASEGIVNGNQPWVLIGGPPCQAYSLAGRSRRANDETFEEDKKHFLYKEYLHIINRFAPHIFVMENVKGLLSSTNSGDQMFDRIMKDLKSPRPGLEYEVHSLVVRKKPSEYVPGDFVIRAEKYGIPQKRHRVILVGIRKDIAEKGNVLQLLEKQNAVTVSDAIFDLPALRSGLSRLPVNEEKTWHLIRAKAAELYPRVSIKESAGEAALSRGSAFVAFPAERRSPNTNFSRWVSDRDLNGAVHHETRAHMHEDLKRYWFAACQAAATGISPKLRHFPDELLPNHANARSETRPFEDRFRVQVANAPSTTVVSHISKDGHYYIHPDPMQMRSLTVREAARLQTFPDNYYFCGNRTSKFHQVGNAVPPMLAFQIAEIVGAYLA